MFKLNKNQTQVLIILIQILLTYLIFWFLLRNLKTNGIWETVVLNGLFFGVSSSVFLKNRKIEKENLETKEKIILKLEIVGVWLIFILLLFIFKDFSFLKLNYLARIDWYVNDWWMLFILNLFFLPVVLFSQELFFRKFLFESLAGYFSVIKILFFQTISFVLFEVLFFGVYDWRFIVFNLLLALFLGFLYHKTRNIWYSFVVRWGLILALDGVILIKIQSFKI